jgi:hypothetical protein
MKQRTYLSTFVKQRTYLITLPDRSPTSEKLGKDATQPLPCEAASLMDLVRLVRTFFHAQHQPRKSIDLALAGNAQRVP